MTLLKIFFVLTIWTIFSSVEAQFYRPDEVYEEPSVYEKIEPETQVQTSILDEETGEPLSTFSGYPQEAIFEEKPEIIPSENPVSPTIEAVKQEKEEQVSWQWIGIVVLLIIVVAGFFLWRKNRQLQIG